MKILYLLSIFFLLSLTSCDIAKEENRPAYVGTWIATGTDDVLDDLGVPTGEVYTWKEVWTVTETTSEFIYTTSLGIYVHEKGSLTITDNNIMKIIYQNKIDEAGNVTPIDPPRLSLSTWTVNDNTMSGDEIDEDGSVLYKWETTRQ